MSKKSIKEITQKDLEVLSSTWSLRMDRMMGKLYYKTKIISVSKGEQEMDLLPYFIMKSLHELGYETPLNKLKHE